MDGLSTAPRSRMREPTIALRAAGCVVVQELLHVKEVEHALRCRQVGRAGDLPVKVPQGVVHRVRAEYVAHVPSRQIIARRVNAAPDARERALFAGVHGTRPASPGSTRCLRSTPSPAPRRA